MLAEAKSAYQEAIRLRPDFAIAHGNLASCFYDEGDMKTAVRCVIPRVVLPRVGGICRSCLHIALCVSRLYKHAIQLEPNFPDAYNNLGNAYREVRSTHTHT